MKKEFDKDRIAELVGELLRELGADTQSEGLRETPRRVANMCCEVLEGMRYTNVEIAEKFSKCFDMPDNNDLVVVKDIEVFSYCEHHLALMYNMKVHVGYIPNGKVIGLSKIARICNMAAKRLQLQERLGADIAEILGIVTGSEDIIVVIEGEHSCMTARGIRASGAKTRTAAIRGLFENDSELRSEFYSLIR